MNYPEIIIDPLTLRPEWLADFADRMSALELPDAPVIDPDACCDLENPEACDSCQ